MDSIDLTRKSMFDAPPKRKKKFVLFLYKMNAKNQEKIRLIEKAIQKTITDFILVRFEDPDEGLKALILKNVEMVIIDSSLFNDDSISVDFGVECKKRKKSPIIFIANDAETLIKKYREKLYLYEEFDTYFNDPVDISEFSKKILQVGKSHGRAAKRFSLNIPLTLYRLNTNSTYQVTLSDISLVGAGITHKNQDIFKKNEQFQIKIPLELFRTFHPQFGEFLPLSLKLRRISISGKTLGLSIEFMTQMQAEALLKLLSIIHAKSRNTKFAPKPRESNEPKKLTMSDVS